MGDTANQGGKPLQHLSSNVLNGPSKQGMVMLRRCQGAPPPPGESSTQNGGTRSPVEEQRLTCTPQHGCRCLSGEHRQGIFDSQGTSLSQCHAAFLTMTQKSRPVLSDEASEAVTRQTILETTATCGCLRCC